ASSLVSIDSAWIERKRLLISFMKNKSVYQIQVKSIWCIQLYDMVHTAMLYGAYSFSLWCIALFRMV
ncbi:MAG: hypothetical protein LKF81_10485, partial [Prevotella sp.]|nr:hypothetical protein [Prevotella sp.]